MCEGGGRGGRGGGRGGAREGYVGGGGQGLCYRAGVCVCEGKRGRPPLKGMYTMRGAGCYVTGGGKLREALSLGGGGGLRGAGPSGKRRWSKVGGQAGGQAGRPHLNSSETMRASGGMLAATRLSVAYTASAAPSIDLVCMGGGGGGGRQVRCWSVRL